MNGICQNKALVTKIKLFFQALTTVISNSNLCTRAFGTKLYNRLRNLQAWAESQGKAKTITKDVASIRPFHIVFLH